MPLPEWSKENDRKRASSPATKTTKELIQLLKKHKIDFRGLLEKPELEELWNKSQAASSTAKTPGGYTNAASEAFSSRGPVHFTHAPAKTSSA